MSVSVSRQQFLRGDWRGRRAAIRPPWLRAEAHFLENCTRCDACIEACPEHIIQRGHGGFPHIDFSRGECTFCAACTAHCPEQLFHDTAHTSSQAPWNIVAEITEECLTYKGVVCRSCAEQCEQRAIGFRPVLGGVFQPELDVSLCTGCGACFEPCPVKAIAMQPSDDEERTSQMREVV